MTLKVEGALFDCKLDKCPVVLKEEGILELNSGEDIFEKYGSDKMQSTIISSDVGFDLVEQTFDLAVSIEL